MKKLFLLSALAVAMLMTACTKDEEVKQDNKPATTSATAYLINQGNWGSNEAEISSFDPAVGTMTNNFFQAKNNRALGDLAQDILQYGSKVYVTVSGSGTIEVLDAKTGVSSKKIEMGDRYPRYMAAEGGKLYVSCYYPASVVRIDTATLETEATCTLGENYPEGICIVGENLYVCNSYGMTTQGGYVYDSTLSVVSLATFTETSRLVIGVNPNIVKVLGDGRLAVACYGNYYDAPAGVALVNVTNSTIVFAEGSVSDIDVYNGSIYILAQVWASDYSYSYGAAYRMDANTLARTEILQSAMGDMVSPNGISVNPANGDIFISDAQGYQANGDLYCFGQDGSQKWKSEVTMIPTHVCFVK